MLRILSVFKYLQLKSMIPELANDDFQNFLNGSSRHRAQFAMPSTPEDFWDLSFPTQPLPSEVPYCEENNSKTKKTNHNT